VIDLADVVMASFLHFGAFPALLRAVKVSRTSSSDVAPAGFAVFAEIRWSLRKTPRASSRPIATVLSELRWEIQKRAVKRTNALI
jgi:hypothetical protein